VERRRIVRADGQLGVHTSHAVAGPSLASTSCSAVGVPATIARTSACWRATTSSCRRAASMAVSLTCMRSCRYAKIAVASRLTAAIVALTMSPASISRDQSVGGKAGHKPAPVRPW
jgi:hypothetical protein